MGLDVYTHLILGAEVKNEEIFVRQESVPRRCAECPKAYAAKQKFCGECGLKFAPLKVTTTWSPKVLAYFAHQGLDISPDDLRSGEYCGSVPFFDVRTIQSSEDRDEASWAVGIKFEGPSMRHERGAPAISWEQLDKARRQVEVTLAGMGLPEREVRLYPVMYVSC